MRAKQIFTYCFCAAFLVCSVLNTSQGAMLSSFIEHYALRSSAQGAVGSSQSLGQALSLFVIFWQAGRMKKPTIIKFSFACAVVILFIISFAPPFALLCALYCAVGIVAGMISSATSSLVADLYEGREVAKYMSRLHAFFGIGGLLAPIFYAALTDRGFKWNITIAITAAVLAAMFVVYLTLSNMALKQITLPESSNQKIKFHELLDFLKSKSGLLVVICVFFYASHQSAIVIWLIRYISVYLNGASFAALALSLFWAGITASRLFAHKVPGAPIKVVIIGNCLSAAAICVGILFGSPLIMTICAPLIGLFNGMTIPVLFAAGCTERSGNTILPANILNLAMFLAQVICPLVVGAIVTYIGMNMGMFLSAICAAVCAALTYVYSRRSRLI